MALRFRICLVCSGNICRSPMAEAVLRSEFARAGLPDRVEISSAGTGAWHVGDAADPRALAVLRAQGYALDHTAQQFDRTWFESLDLVIALDSGHLRALRRLAPDSVAASKVRLLRSFDPSSGDDLDVPDPYYGPDADFATVLTLIESAAPGVVDEVRRELLT